ncbi:hypothetical protein DBR06_SOUSAS37610011, partial [Sousa chinensis]
MGRKDVSAFEGSHTLYSRPLGVSAVGCPVCERFPKPLVIQLINTIKISTYKAKTIVRVMG